MMAPMDSNETAIRVRYAETDQMGVVYHANYLVWMEVGRVELCRANGFAYGDMEKQDGIILAVVEAQCHYKHPARYDDEILVKTWIEESSTRAVRFAYEMRRAADNRLLATGYTRHVFCGWNMRPKRLPQQYHELFGVHRHAVPAGE
jgi:acyl-CoA thioester hydrolase